MSRPSTTSSGRRCNHACCSELCHLEPLAPTLPARPPFAAQVRPYLLYVLQFVVGIYTNMKALQHSNIDTVIVFRASCPLAVCVLEWAFLGRQLPNCRSCLALLCILLGVLGYVSADKSFVVGGIHAYTWVIAYTLVTATQMAYGKYIVGPDMKFASMWRPRPPTAPPPAHRTAARAPRPHREPQP